MVRKKLPNVKLYLSTNSQLLGEDRSRKIIDDLLDVINFLRRFYKKTFERGRLEKSC